MAEQINIDGVWASVSRDVEGKVTGTLSDLHHHFMTSDLGC